MELLLTIGRWIVRGLGWIYPAVWTLILLVIVHDVLSRRWRALRAAFQRWRGPSHRSPVGSRSAQGVESSPAMAAVVSPDPVPVGAVPVGAVPVGAVPVGAVPADQVPSSRITLSPLGTAAVIAGSVVVVHQLARLLRRNARG